MEVEFELTPEDLKAFRSHALTRKAPGSGGWRLPWGIWCPPVGVFLGFALVVGILDGAWRTALAGWFFGFMAAVAVMRRWSAHRAQVEEQALKAVTEGTTRRFVLSADGVAQSTLAVGQWLSWRSVDEVPVTDTHVFFYTGPREAWIVPKRAFRDETAAQEFVSLAQRYHREGQAAPGGEGKPAPSGGQFFQKQEGVQAPRAEPPAEALQEGQGGA